MPQTTFIHSLDLLVCQPGPRLDDDGLLELLLGIYDDPDFRPGMDELWWFLDTHDVQVSGAGLRQIARTFPRRQDVGARPNFTAIVTRGRLGLGLSRLYGAYAERAGQVTLEVFDGLRGAADWLDDRRGRAQATSAAVAARLVAGQDPAP